MANVVGIGRQNTSSVFQRILKGAIAPPFFLVGILAGLFGTSYLGALLWLQLNGHGVPGANFIALRKAHAAAQLLLFFGAFVSGFLLQAMPRLMETSNLRPLYAICLLPIFVLGSLLIFLRPFSALGYWIIGAHFLIITALVVRFALLAPRHALYRSGIPIAWATSWLAIGAFLDVSRPHTALLVFWGAYIPLIEVTVRRVFFALVQIDERRNQISLLNAGLYVLATLAGALYFYFESDTFWHVFEILTLLTVLTYVWPRLPKRAIKLSPPALAFWIGMFWLLTGSFSLFFGPNSADSTLHIWANGLALPLILVVAPQVLRGHLGVQVFYPKIHIAIILLWQCVPLCRGLARLFQLPATFAALASPVTVLVLVIWSVAMLSGLVRGWKRNSA